MREGVAQLRVARVLHVLLVLQQVMQRAAGYTVSRTAIKRGASQAVRRLHVTDIFGTAGAVGWGPTTPEVSTLKGKRAESLVSGHTRRGAVHHTRSVPLLSSKTHAI